MEGYWWAFSGSFDMIFLCRKAVHLWDCMHMKGSGFQLALKLLENIALAIGTFVFSLGGAIVGGIAGAMKGQTTETGLCRGAAIGVMSGAIVALELFDSLSSGHIISKVALLGSIFNGKAFREWVSPAVLKAYQWQTSTNDGPEVSGLDIYNIDETRGLSPEHIERLPEIDLHCNLSSATLPSEVCCTICLQDFVKGERATILPACEHLFHKSCIDKWLERNASCPVCRKTVDSEEYWDHRNVRS